MGYYSTISDFEQFRFQLTPGTTKEEIIRLLNAIDTDHWEQISFWLDLEIDEDSMLSLEPVGESGKAYWLEPALNALIRVLEPLQSPEDPSGLRGLRIRFELWGEEPNDATLYTSDGKQLFATVGKMGFSGEPKPV